MRFSTLFLSLLVACGEADTPEPAAEEPVAEKAAAEKPVAEKPAEAETEAADADVHPGKKIYDTKCVVCHGADGKGNGGMGGDYAAVLPGKTDEELSKSIKEGKTGAIGAMPPWGAVLDDEQVADVLDYVKTSFGGA